MTLQLPTRCAWVSNDKQYQDYHDHVWGRPVTDDQELFAKLCLDGQQAGLSWLTILRKQAHYEQVFHYFDAEKIVRMTEDDVQRLMQDQGIIRNRLKILAIIKNARAYLEIQQKGKFSEFIWQFTDHQIIKNRWDKFEQVPTSTKQSDSMAKALKKAGFSFVGTTICYAFMQAVGMVNDHTTDCFCFAEVSALQK